MIFALICVLYKHTSLTGSVNIPDNTDVGLHSIESSVGVSEAHVGALGVLAPVSVKHDV